MVKNILTTENTRLEQKIKELQTSFESFQETEKKNKKKDYHAKNKLIKEKDKDIYRLEQKCDNLASNLKKFKEDTI